MPEPSARAGGLAASGDEPPGVLDTRQLPAGRGPAGPAPVWPPRRRLDLPFARVARAALLLRPHRRRRARRRAAAAGRGAARADDAADAGGGAGDPGRAGCSAGRATGPGPPAGRGGGADLRGRPQPGGALPHRPRRARQHREPGGRWSRLLPRRARPRYRPCRVS